MLVWLQVVKLPLVFWAFLFCSSNRCIALEVSSLVTHIFLDKTFYACSLVRLREVNRLHLVCPTCCRIILPHFHSHHRGDSLVGSLTSHTAEIDLCAIYGSRVRATGLSVRCTRCPLRVHHRCSRQECRQVQSLEQDHK